MTGVLPYGRQTIDEDDVAAVAEALRSDFLTTGPRVEAFEHAFAETVGAPHAVTCANGTAALHLAMLALGVGEGDVCIVPSITFLATANCARYVGAEVVFADVDPASGLMTEATLADAIARSGDRKIAAVLPVHLRGDVADLPAIRRLADEAGAVVVEDACHALGSRMTFGNQPASVGDGRWGDLAVFSFHPVKTLTTGEGGMVTARDPALAERVRRFRSHGMVREAGAAPWVYEMAEVGFNYRLPDVLCALGLSQLGKLAGFVERRRALAARYQAALASLAPIARLAARPAWSDPALHLLTVLIDFEAAGRTRAEVMAGLRQRGVGSQVHYIPVHTQPYYRARYGDLTLPGAAAWYARCLTLPLFPAMADADVDHVVAALAQVLVSPTITIAGRCIGADHPPYVICELSGNHNGSLERALAMIEAAAATGCDAIKLQTYTADTLTLACDGPGFRIEEGPWAGRTLHDLYAEAMTPYEWHAALFERAARRGVTIFSTPFDATAVELLESLGAPAYKIASFEAVDLPLIARVAACGKPMIISTGLASLAEMGEALETARASGAAEVALLHCVSAYPAPIEEANVRTVPDLARRFGVVTGLSDHTPGSAAAIAAVALGAAIIEKHFTLARADGGPDAAFSLEPAEFAALTLGCKAAWSALGSATYDELGSERAAAGHRRSLYVAADIPAGELLTAANVRSVRPGYGLAPKHLAQVLGRRAARSLKFGEPLAWDMVS